MSAGPPIPLVDLKAQYLSIKGEIDAALKRVLQRADFILGEEVRAFEKEFAAFCRVDHCVGCASGTDALALALKGLGIGPGDEVLTVANTFFATAEAIVLTGARPVFVDVRDDSLLMDTSRIEAALTTRTKAVVPVHLFGRMVDMEAIMNLARTHHFKVVEDAAQAHGADYRGVPAGAYGDAGIFSFYPGKNLGAYGDAGAVVTNNFELAAWLRMARNHGRRDKHTHVFWGQNSRMDEIQAAVLRAKLPHLEKWNLRRRALASHYQRLLSKLPGVRGFSGEGEGSVFHLFVVRVKDRDTLRQRLAKDGISTGVHYPLPLNRQPAYRKDAGDAPSLPVTEKTAEQILSLPLYPEMDEKSVERIVEAIARAQDSSPTS